MSGISTVFKKGNMHSHQYKLQLNTNCLYFLNVFLHHDEASFATALQAEEQRHVPQCRPIVKWIRACLSNRRQRVESVEINGVYVVNMHCVDVTSGIHSAPETLLAESPGSILGSPQSLRHFVIMNCPQWSRVVRSCCETVS